MIFLLLSWAPMMIFGLRNKLLLFAHHYQTPCTCIQSSLVKTRQFCDWLLIERDWLTSQDRSTLVTSQPLVNTICISFQLCQLQTGLNFGILLLNCYFRLYVHWRWACFARNASVRNKSMKKAVWLSSWLLRSPFQYKLLINYNIPIWDSPWQTV